MSTTCNCRPRVGAPCDICRQPLTDLATTSLVFGRDGPPQLVHDYCGRDIVNPYIIGLDRIIDHGDRADPHRIQDSLEMWKIHLRHKNWFWESWCEDLARAHVAALGIAGRKRAVAPASTPRAAPPSTTRRATSLSLRARILERDSFRCRRCGATSDTCKLVVDHVVPVALGGTTTPVNLQTLCTDCNAGKLARPPHEHDLRGLTP